MIFLNKINTRKLVIVIIVSFILLSKFYLNSKTKDAFIELSNKNIVKISIDERSLYFSDKYVFSNKEKIKTILEYLVRLNKKYYPYTDSLSWKGRTTYHFSFEYNHSTPHYAYLIIHGKEYITLRIYNYSNEEYEWYRAKIKIDEDEIKKLLIELKESKS